jgi:hypothetical protein
MAFNLSGYLDNENIETDWDMFGQNDLTIHWSNWDMSCQLMRTYFKNNPNNLNFLGFKTKYRQVFEQLLYVKHGDQIFTQRLETFYEEYFSKQDKAWWWSSKFEKVECHVSLKLLNSEPLSFRKMQWFNKEDYSIFIYNKILTGDPRIPIRNFSIKTNIDIVASTDSEFNNNLYLKISQISDNGMLFKMTNEVYDELVKGDSTYIKCPKYDWTFTKNYRHHQMLNILSDLHFNEMMKQTISIDFNKVLSKYHNLGLANEIDLEYKYVYMGYSDFYDKAKGLEKTFKPIITSIQYFLLNEIDGILFSLKKDELDSFTKSFKKVA